MLLCDRWLGITVLSCRAWPVTEETEVCPLLSYHDADGKQVSCCHCPFLPCRSCCPCGIRSKGMPEFSSELSLLSDLAEGVGSQQRIPFDKTARHAQPCVCSIHMTLVTGQSVCLAVVFQVHQHSFPLPLSPPEQIGCTCLLPGRSYPNGSALLWLPRSSRKHRYTPYNRDRYPTDLTHGVFGWAIAKPSAGELIGSCTPAWVGLSPAPGSPGSELGSGHAGAVWERAVPSTCKRFVGVLVFSSPAPHSHAQWYFFWLPGNQLRAYGIESGTWVYNLVLFSDSVRIGATVFRLIST